jgi:deoxyribonuclease-4
VERGCETIQIFVSSPRGWKHSEVPPDRIAAFREKREQAGIDPVFVHTIYLINLAAPDSLNFGKSVASLQANAEMAAAIGSAAVITHLGHHGGEGEEAGLKRVIEALEATLPLCGECTPILLETTAGERNSVGGLFEQLGRILHHFEGEPRLGICMDTCHVFGAGYDLRDPASVDRTLDTLDREVGLHKLHAIHANDSKGQLGSHLDRHANIGEGNLGLAAFEALVNHPALREMPFLIETPHNTVEDDLRNLASLRALVHV